MRTQLGDPDMKPRPQLLPRKSFAESLSNAAVNWSSGTVRRVAKLLYSSLPRTAGRLLISGQIAGLVKPDCSCGWMSESSRQLRYILPCCIRLKAN